MFALIGLGVQEILVLLVLAGGLAGIVFLFLSLSRRGDGRSAELEEENRRLREENDRLRGGS